MWSYTVMIFHLRVEVYIQCLWVGRTWREVLLVLLVVERLLMRVQIIIWWALLPQQVVRCLARTRRHHRRCLRVRVESFCVGVLAGGGWGNWEVLGVSPLWVVLWVCVVGLVWQFASELSQCGTPAALVFFIRVRPHFVISGDNAGLLFQHAEHQAFPLDEQAGPRQLRAVQSDPVPVWALEHWRCTWKSNTSSMRFRNTKCFSAHTRWWKSLQEQHDLKATNAMLNICTTHMYNNHLHLIKRLIKLNPIFSYVLYFSEKKNWYESKGKEKMFIFTWVVEAIHAFPGG